MIVDIYIPVSTAVPLTVSEMVCIAIYFIEIFFSAT